MLSLEDMMHSLEDMMLSLGDMLLSLEDMMLSLEDIILSLEDMILSFDDSLLTEEVDHTKTISYIKQRFELYFIYKKRWRMAPLEAKQRMHNLCTELSPIITA